MGRKTEEKGITLLTLIITIIIMLILIVVETKFIVDTDLIGITEKTSEIQSQKKIEEEIEFKKSEIIIDGYQNQNLTEVKQGESGEIIIAGNTIEGASIVNGTITSEFDSNGSKLGKELSGVVVLPEGITTIGPASFGISTNIKSLIISEGVTAIEQEAFFGCEGLENIMFPKTLTSIGAYSFMDCKSLKEVYIPSNVTSIGSMAFYRCNNLEKVIIVCDGKEDLSKDSPNYPWGIDENIIQFSK